ncbi:MAG TPA: 16S rRNA (uracil(1498)-N(3))-methyltransferase, partial [Mycobacterium sp.]|nr:16S rRNA (uracil(1498)-N(3))-methyltransferase [Mycobacterium sp.]
YADTLPGVGGLAVLDGDEGFHAATVRRLRIGERIVIGDGNGELADCAVAGTGKRELTATVLARRTERRPVPAVTVVQAIPKAERSELAVELATEAGADAILAWQAARCVARWDGPKAEKGLRRWRAVARSAARQSRRAFIPDVDGVLSTSELLDRVPGTLTLALHEVAATKLRESHFADVASINLVVGPEGGLSDEEIGELTAAGAHAVRLGPTVLRTSTAAAVALGALGALTRRWDD